jgi:MscS family membrane protein
MPHAPFNPDMKRKYQIYFNTFIACLVLLLAWSVWNSMAQGVRTNAAATNAPATNAVVQPPESLGAQHLDVATDWLQELSRKFPFLRRVILGNELWKYLASLLYIFLAYYLSKLADLVTRICLKKWAQKTASKIDDLFVDLLHGPVKAIVFLLFLHVGLRVFRWPATIAMLISKGFTVAIACVLTYMALKVVDIVLGYWRQRAAADADRSFDDQLLPIVRKTLKAFVIVVAILVTCQNLQIDITAAIASLSIGGLAVGLAAQDSLANFFGAVAVLVDKPFSVGDTVRIDAHEGTVETIGLRSTRIRNPDGFLVGNATIINLSHRASIRTELNIGLTYDTPPAQVDRAIAILKEVFGRHPKTKDLIIGFNKFTDSSLNILVQHWWDSKDIRDHLAGIQEMNLALKKRFDEEGIEFAFPTQTVHVKQDGPTPPADAAGKTARASG